MTSKRYIWINGDMISSDTPALVVGNRSFLYGDGLFETIHAYGTQGRNLNLHLSRLKRGMEILNIDLPPFLDENMLSKEITRLLNKNRIFESARVRLTVYRNQGGKYIPENNVAGIIIEVEPLELNMYQLNSKGYTIELYHEIRKPVNSLSSIKSCNSLHYILAGIFLKNNGVNDCLLINEHDRIAEAISSNVFIVKDDNIYTPAISEGCIPGVMREVIIKVAPKLGLKVNNQVAIPVQKLLDCDEVFLTNAITGIRWVGAFRQQRYFNKISKLLTDEINRFTFPDQLKEGSSG
ncbi:MAG: 4-amino-4-deoxychorismate lyase [Bacteroidales bacterium]|nr:MAG: 4-amino-4-deoxychorismate lyase [Bacteroidales bacterium]